MRKIKLINSLFAVALSVMLFSCSKDKNVKPNQNLTTTSKSFSGRSITNSVIPAGFSLGSDLSWAAQMYANGRVWRNADSVVQPLQNMFHSFSQTAISFRVFVNPSDDPYNGHCSPAEVAQAAKVYYSTGYKIAICCMYGDTWNSIGRQVPPAAWANYNYDQMKAAMVAHVLDVMNRLKAVGVTPTWFKNGDEINSGVVHPIGSISNPTQMVGLLNATYDAAKSVFPNIIVIVHTGQPQGSSAAPFWSTFTANGGKFDVMGTSCYANNGNIPAVFADIKALQANYAPTKPLIQVEFGGPWNRGYTATSLKTWIANIASLPNSSGGGVWYWEPECYNWNNYNLGAWDPTSLEPSSGIMQAFNGN